jgi:predicted NBD/HSP70 family sugar kinase
MRGCVEAKAGGWALARDLKALGHETDDSWDVVGLLRAHEPDAVRLLGEAGRVLGHAIADAVSFFNPSHVVLGGEIAHAHQHLLATVREVVYSRSLPLATRSLQIGLSELGERAGVIGGAYRGIEHRIGADEVDAELDRRLSSGQSLDAWAWDGGAGRVAA